MLDRHPRRKIIEAKRASLEIAPEAIEMMLAIYAVEKRRQEVFCRGAPTTAIETVGAKLVAG
jgi:hypothetical protein